MIDMIELAIILLGYLVVGLGLYWRFHRLLDKVYDVIADGELDKDETLDLIAEVEKIITFIKGLKK